LDFQGILKGGWGRLMVNVSKKVSKKRVFVLLRNDPH
jgi:hypothetical protein